MLSWVYVNVMDKRVLTAEKILGNAESLLNLVKAGKHLKIVTDKQLRKSSIPYTHA